MARKLTPRGEARRAELMAFAIERFAANGYHPTSVAEIVDGLGVGKGVFYWYFDSKEQLFLEILRDGLRDLRRAQRRAIKDEPDPVRRIEIGLATSIAWWADHRDLYRLIRFALTEATFAPAISQSEGVATRDVARHVREAMGTGRIPRGDPVAVAHAILGVAGRLARIMLLEEDHPVEDVTEAAIRFCRGGLLGADPTPDVRSA